MKLLWILAKYSPGFFALIAALSVLSGACNAILLGLISSELSGEEMWLPSTGWNFLGLVFLVLVSGYAARVAVLYLASRSSYDLRMSLCQQILNLPLRDFEKIGESQIFAVLTQDISIISATLLKVPELMVAVSILVGCVIYLLALSPFAVLSLAVFVALLFFTYRMPVKSAERILERAREVWDQLMGNFKIISAGFKELKLHAARRHSFITEDLRDSADRYRQVAFAGQHVNNIAKSWGKTSFLVFVGFILYGISAIIDMKMGALTAFTLTLLYMRDSVTKTLDVIPELTEARVSMKKIERYGLSLASFKREFALPRTPAFTMQKALGDGSSNGFQGLQLSGVSHRYYHEGEDGDFVLGPLDLEVKPGELVFVIGGNGSGKTTLAKLLIGLYIPEEGEIHCNDRLVSDESREQYRQLFTATFTDFYIFDRLIGLDSPDLEQRCHHYLATLQLDHKVKVRDGWFSTTKLSQGQRKRLVLLTAYLENRPIYVFDEWAADQDPTFKQFFYLELLPELKKNGKTIIVISHDDRYYHVGDRVVKLEDGQLVSDTPVSEALPVPVSAYGPPALADRAGEASAAD